MAPHIDRVALSRTLVIHNGKGGALKTSLASHFSALLAVAGYQVLLIDADPQGNCADDLGYSAASDGGLNFRKALTTGQPIKPNLSPRENLDVVCGGTELDDFPDAANTHEMLAVSLSPIAQQYDIIVIDTPPGGSPLIKMALGAARWLIIPTPADASSIKGLQLVADKLEDARDSNPDLELLCAVLTRVGHQSTAIKSQAKATLTTILGDAAPLLTSTVRVAERAAVSVRGRGLLAHELTELQDGKPIWSFLRAGEAIPSHLQSARSDRLAARGLAADYFHVTDELLNLIHAAETEGESSS